MFKCDCMNCLGFLMDRLNLTLVWFISYGFVNFLIFLFCLHFFFSLFLFDLFFSWHLSYIYLVGVMTMMFSQHHLMVSLPLMGSMTYILQIFIIFPFLFFVQFDPRCLECCTMSPTCSPFPPISFLLVAFIH